MDNNENNQSFQPQPEPQVASQPEMQPTPQPEMQPTPQPSPGIQGVGAPLDNNQSLKKISSNSMFTIIAAVVALAIFVVIMIVFMDDGKGNTNQYNNNESSQDNQEEQTDVDISMMQRDTQRRDDMARMISQLNQYQANNRGQVPHTAFNGEPVGAYNMFIDEYLKVAGDIFADPLTGDDYEVVKFVECSSDECEDVSADENVETGKIYVYSNAKCMEDNSLGYIKGERKVAITMALEAGGVACYNN